MSTFGTFVVKMGGVDVEYPVSVNSTFVCTFRTIERCLVGQLALSVVSGGNHSQIYHPNMDKGIVCYLNQSSLQNTKSRLSGTAQRLLFVTYYHSTLSVLCIESLACNPFLPTEGHDMISTDV